MDGVEDHSQRREIDKILAESALGQVGKPSTHSSTGYNFKAADKTQVGNSLTEMACLQFNHILNSEALMIIMMIINCSKLLLLSSTQGQFDQDG